MNPQLVYVITQQRVAEFHRAGPASPAEREPPSIRDGTALQAPPRRAASIAEGGQLR